MEEFRMVATLFFLASGFVTIDLNLSFNRRRQPLPFPPSLFFCFLPSPSCFQFFFEKKNVNELLTLRWLPDDVAVIIDLREQNSYDTLARYDGTIVNLFLSSFKFK